MGDLIPLDFIIDVCFRMIPSTFFGSVEGCEESACRAVWVGSKQHQGYRDRAAITCNYDRCSSLNEP